MSRFLNKIVLVAGATSGIGEITAYRFAQEKATLILLGRREEKGLSVLQKCIELGASSKSVFYKTDLSKMKDLNIAFDNIKNNFGYLDCAVNNAAIEEKPMPIETKTEEIYDNLMNTNLKSVFFSMQREIELMRVNKNGSIVNTASISGVIGQVGIPIYNGAKHAILGMTKSLGIELAKENIRVNAVSPGAIKTELYDRYIKDNPDKEAEFTAMHPIGRIGRSEEVAGAILWLCSSESTFVIGQNILVDGGYTAQ